MTGRNRTAMVVLSELWSEMLRIFMAYIRKMGKEKFERNVSFENDQ